MAVDLITQCDSHDKRKCVGLYVFNPKSREVDVIQAKFVALATGGAKQDLSLHLKPRWRKWRWHSDGLASRLQSRKYGVQPISSDLPLSSSRKIVLISEALRGEGAMLELPDGTRFMSKFDERVNLRREISLPER